MHSWPRCKASSVAALAILLSAQVASGQPATPGHAPTGLGEAPTGPKLTRAPKMVKFVEAPYPEEEKANSRTAAVILKLGISPTGTVDQVVVVESAGPAFDAAAVAAARQFVFDPAEIDNKPAAIRILYRYEFVIKQEKPKTIFTGAVMDRKKKVPLAGVTVELDTGEKVVTDEKGKFHFEDLTAGKHTVSLSGEHLTALRTDETLEEGKQLEATYQVEPQEEGDEKEDLEIVIVAPALQKQTVATEITAEQGRKLPGTQGDVLKVVESMPGVARAAAGSAALVVWGAGSADTRIYVEGVRIPVLYHNGGVRSVIHSDMVQGVELVPGGYAAPYGRGLGGLLTVQLRPIEQDRVHGSVNVDLLDSSVAVRAPVTDRLAASVAVRQSYLDSVLGAVTSEDIGDFFPIPRYRDGQARLVVSLSDRETAELGGFLSNDQVDRTVVSPDPSEIKRETRTLSFQRLYLRYRKTTQEGTEVTATPWIGWDSSSVNSRFGPTPTNLTQNIDSYGLRITHRSRPANWVTTTLGLDGELDRGKLSRTGSITSPAREGDVRVFGQPPSDQINADDWEVASGSLAPFAEADITPFGEDRLHIIPGVRIDPYFVSVNRRAPVKGDDPSVGLFDMDLLFEPRLALQYSFDPRVTVKAAWGRYHQAPAHEDLSSVFGNPTLGNSSANHWLFGFKFQLSDKIAEETTFFYANSDNLAVRNSAPTLPTAQALVATGLGRVFGAQVMVRKELSSRVFGWLSYTLLRSERAIQDGAPYRLFDYDQTHVLTALASLDLGYEIELGARVRYATGYPRTPVVGVYGDSVGGGFQPRFGPQNSIRIPSFFQADVRISKRFHLGRTVVEAYFDVENATNRVNPEEIVYSSDYKQRRYVTGLPVLPVAGVRWTW